MPLGVMQAGIVAFEPPLSSEQTAALGRLGVARYTKVFLHYPKPWWRDEDGRPFVLCVADGDHHFSALMLQDESVGEDWCLEATLTGADADACVARAVLKAARRSMRRGRRRTPSPACGRAVD